MQTESQTGAQHAQDKIDTATGSIDKMSAKLNEVIEDRKQQETCNPNSKRGCSG